jgi:hypothetical protein
MKAKQNASMGSNLTGLAASGERAEEMQEGMEEFPPTSSGSTHGPAVVRVLYAREGGTIGSVPPPSGITGKAKAVAKKLAGGEPTLFMDKLGERLVFERTGTRLYEALVSKHEAWGTFEGGPSRDDLVEILNDEHAHFMLLCDVVEELGGDPTAMTPSADLAATISEGLLKVLTDPRTTLLQCLEAILVAELTDVSSWEVLTQLANDVGEEELAQQFEEAQETEEEHLALVRNWLAIGQGRVDHAAE